MPGQDGQAWDAHQRMESIPSAAPAGAMVDDDGRSAEECWVRLRELQHRTRNDLQLISALAIRHGRGLADPAAKVGFDAIARHAILLARLYGDLLSVHREGSTDLAEHLSRLCAGIRGAKDLDGRGIELLAETQAVHCGPEAVTALGLAVNELITNAVEHAFPGGRQGRITVRLLAGPGQGSSGERGEAGTATLLVADDGPGFPDPAPGGSGLGLGLAQWLVRRAGGTLTREVAHGTVWRVHLP